MLPEGAPLEVLGSVLALEDATQTEIEHRIAIAWRKFWSLKRLLLNHKVSVKRRLKLFDSTVGSCALWCCRRWTPRLDDLRRLRGAYRAMPRRICGLRRGPTECYLDWIRRTTRRACRTASETGIRGWIHNLAASKWAWAGHVARRSARTWLWKMTFWRDSEWTRMSAECGGWRPLRPERRRWMKWEFAIQQYAKESGLGNWARAAAAKDTWESHRDGFAAFACRSL